MWHMAIYVGCSLGGLYILGKLLIWFFFGEIKEIEVKVSAFDFCVSTYVFVCFVS